MKENLLFKKIKEGDKESFKWLFCRLYPKLVVYAQNYTFNKEKSEDLVQDVFLHLWEHASEMDIHTSLQAYLYSMTRNHCISYLRSIRVVDSSHMLDNLADAALQKDKSEQEAAAEYKRVLILVESFPERMRDIFKLKYFENYTYAEIAESLGISLNTVKTQLKRAKNKLKEDC